MGLAVMGVRALAGMAQREARPALELLVAVEALVVRLARADPLESVPSGGAPARRAAEGRLAVRLVL